MEEETPWRDRRIGENEEEEKDQTFGIDILVLMRGLENCTCRNILGASGSFYFDFVCSVDTKEGFYNLFKLIYSALRFDVYVPV